MKVFYIVWYHNQGGATKTIEGRTRRKYEEKNHPTQSQSNEKLQRKGRTLNITCWNIRRGLLAKTIATHTVTEQ